jgi:hypothetical protein
VSTIPAAIDASAAAVVREVLARTPVPVVLLPRSA